MPSIEGKREEGEIDIRRNNRCKNLPYHDLLPLFPVVDVIGGNKGGSKVFIKDLYILIEIAAKKSMNGPF